MPGKIKVKILAGRNLPVMDRSGDTTDAYVELKFGNITYKTDVCRKSLNPQWNSEWYRFEVDDAELQDEPLQIRLMDHDTYSANDAIGKVYINLNPLLLPSMLPAMKNVWTMEASMNTSVGSQGSVMTGWIPVYDTMHGIRGEVNIIIKVELFSDFNKFRQSSCGVQFFYSPNIPYGYHAQMIHGFVEELVVSDDPEYKWIDKIRTPRASNEARQTLFFKLSGEVQRKIGLKALDLGGNAVIGYLQNFDLEGESGIVARGIGTAVTLVKLHDVLGFLCDNANIEEIAFSSRTKTQIGHLETDNSAPLVSTSVRFPASYPMHMSIKPVDRTNSQLHASLTRLERAAESSGIRGGVRMRRKHAKRIPFFRFNTSILNEVTNDTTNLTRPEYLIDETVRSLRIMLTPPLDIEKESPKCRFSKHIEDLRAKFDSIAAETGRCLDADSIRSFNINANDPKKEARNFRETKTTGKIMAALLIGSIQDMPLENIGNVDSISPVSSNSEQPNEEVREIYRKKEDSHDFKENVNDDVNVEEEFCQDASSSVDETEMSSLDDDDDDDDSGSSDDVSGDSTSYNILDDSRYSFDGNLNITEDLSNFREKIPVARFNAEDSTNFTLQKNDSDTNTTDRLLSNINLAHTEDVMLRNDEIPIITVDIHENANSDDSVDTSLLPNENRLDISTFSSKSTDQSDNRPREADDARQASDASKKHRGSTLGTDKRYDSIAKSDDLPHEVHRVHPTYHERDLCQERNQFVQPDEQSIRLKFLFPSKTEGCVNADRRRRDPVATTERSSSREMIDIDALHEEVNARPTIDRQTSIHDLIKLIDAKMMVSATAHDRRTVSLRNTKKKSERTHKMPISKTSLKKFPSHGSSTKRNFSHHGRDIPLRVLRDAWSTADHLSSGQHPNVSSHTVSCISSSTGLTSDDHHTRVSTSLKRAAAIPIIPDIGIDRQSDIPKALKTSLESSHCNDGIITIPSNVSDSIYDKLTHANHPTSQLPPSITVIRKSSSVCNLAETCFHIDRNPTNTANMTYNLCVSYPFPDLRQQDEAISSVSPSYPLPVVSSVTARVSQSPATRALPNVPLHRRSSDSDLSVTPKGNSLGSDRSMAAGPLRTPAAVVRPMNQDTLEMLEYPFITMQHYPPGFILHIGGLVSSRSVKLLERISNLEEPEGRDAWWTEIRMEVRSHARALACNVVIGYKEETSICDDVCVLSASGTAAVINFHNSTQDPDSVLNKLQQNVASVAIDVDREKSQQKSTTAKIEKTDTDTFVTTHSEKQSGRVCRHLSESNDHEGSYQSQLRCSLCHLPYSESSVPFRVNVSKCAICKRARVPDVMFTTIEVPANIPTTGRGCFIQATVCKSKKDLRGELNAKEISDCLPFLEYELHSLLLNKLKVKGMNAIFGLRLEVSVGERFIIGMAVGTAVYLTALPLPSIPQIASGNSWHNEEQLAEIQRSIVETVKKNREFYHLKPIGINDAENGRVTTSDTDESDEDLPELDLGLGTRDACVLEVDDIEDMDRISSLMDNRPPDDFHVVNTQTIPGLEDLEIVRNLQMFTQVSRAKIPTGQFASMPSKYFTRLLQSLYFKLRRMVPCALCDMQFKVALTEQDEIQLTVVGMALGLGEPLKTNKYKRKVVCRSLSKDQVRKPDDSDMIFSLDEDQLENNVTPDSAIRTIVGNPIILGNASIQKSRQRSPLRSKTFSTHRRKHVPLKGRYGVDITPLSYLPGGRIERYQGNLNFFFIRESTSIRENGGLSGFTHSFVMEVLAIVRAHITALGGNAMVAFFMTQCVLLHSPHKNQGQCLINVGGDVVTVSYYADEKHNTVSNC